MKTNLPKHNISIQFEDEPCWCAPLFLQNVVENCVLFVVLDGSTYFLRRYFQRVLCTVDDTRALLHENQGVAISDLVLLLFF